MISFENTAFFVEELKFCFHNSFFRLLNVIFYVTRTIDESSRRKLFNEENSKEFMTSEWKKSPLTISSSLQLYQQLSSPFFDRGRNSLLLTPKRALPWNWISRCSVVYKTVVNTEIFYISWNSYAETPCARWFLLFGKQFYVQLRRACHKRGQSKVNFWSQNL
jgi:hypothetical protein